MSNIVNAPFAAPWPTGLNTTLIVQLAPEDIAGAQLFVCENGPLDETLPIERVEPPVFDNVTTCGELEVATNCAGKVRVEVDKETTGGVAPVPLNEMRRVEPFVPFTVRSPVRGPSTVGVNAMLKVQLVPPGTPRRPPGAPRAGQVVLCAKSPVI